MQIRTLSIITGNSFSHASTEGCLAPLPALLLASSVQQPLNSGGSKLQVRQL